MILVAVICLLPLVLVTLYFYMSGVFTKRVNTRAEGNAAIASGGMDTPPTVQ
jgi:hypothetical protein